MRGKETNASMSTFSWYIKVWSTFSLMNAELFLELRTRFAVVFPSTSLRVKLWRSSVDWVSEDVLAKCMSMMEGPPHSLRENQPYIKSSSPRLDGSLNGKNCFYWVLERLLLRCVQILLLSSICNFITNKALTMALKSSFTKETVQLQRGWTRAFIYWSTSCPRSCWLLRTSACSFWLPQPEVR